VVKNGSVVIKLRVVVQLPAMADFDIIFLIVFFFQHDMVFFGLSFNGFEVYMFSMLYIILLIQFNYIFINKTMTLVYKLQSSNTKHYNYSLKK